MVAPVRNKVGPPPPPTAGGVTLGAGGTAIAPGRPVAPGGAAGGGRGGANLPPVEADVYVNPRGGVEEDYPLDAHTRNFLDCIKSRQKPNARVRDRLLTRRCRACWRSSRMQKGKPLGWDAQARASKVALDRPHTGAVTRAVPRPMLCTARAFTRHARPIDTDHDET